MNPLFALIPAPYRVLAAALAIAVVLGGCYFVGRSHGADKVQAKWDKAKSEQMAAAIAAEKEAREKEKALNEKLQKAQDDAIAREKKLRADADAVRAVNSSLRDDIAALRRGLSGDSAEACRARADTALALFGECAAFLGRVAEAADAHASDALKLSDAWPK